ncbi:V-type ATP synthase subunit F [Candidatus Lokiarchaeum ossiferum]|uniref:V-type ATP synthase subunit F n=1 Tax=Candidatus Lokiarchaeum ossiferum TaxID=2951803 RepID=UPI00352C6F73
MCVSDDDTNILFRLIGIKSFEISSNNSEIFQEEFDKILEDQDIGLVLLNEKYLMRQRDYFRRLKLRKYPIIIEIPDMKAPLKESYFRHLIEKYLGLTLKEG